ncbi:peptide-methionine (S)-S-oxide reductase [Paenibacillus phyllosphaerae]|uniref:Peptide methionine sulfoxide reductase MsrA n=1 Tax=Paenibacillus phyllosphaerae TaxID=274593 RepID=A0A7W5FQG3_9BACL|nr:peptide-methionine (S)-S-oxide reductase MsrA [Paenibacillus phyllosphaerae]MBB3113217.1 peptide-methionine (S)-S-oxide reductase [Paenibacillus phyllosphaerae]
MMSEQPHVEYKSGRMPQCAYTEGKHETITLGMGCFWGPEALFGQLPGVQRTRVGFAGGTAPDPTYRQMGDHSEVVEVDYIPALLPLAELLELFWNSHNPDNINGYKGRQYWSMALYRNEAQLAVIKAALQKRAAEGLNVTGAATEVAPFAAFYLAEDKHQKYYLKRYPDAIEKLSKLYPEHDELVHSTLAARLNGVAKGYASRERILADIASWPIDSASKEAMLAVIRQIRW